MTPSYIGYTDEQPKRIQKAYIGVNDDPHTLLRIYVGDQSGYVKPAYVATTSSSTTYLTSAVDSSGLSSTTALTCASTSGESYLTSEETTGTSTVSFTDNNENHLKIWLNTYEKQTSSNGAIYSGGIAMTAWTISIDGVENSYLLKDNTQTSVFYGYSYNGSYLAASVTCTTTRARLKYTIRPYQYTSTYSPGMSWTSSYSDLIQSMSKSGVVLDYDSEITPDVDVILDGFYGSSYYSGTLSARHWGTVKVHNLSSSEQLVNYWSTYERYSSNSYAYIDATSRESHYINSALQYVSCSTRAYVLTYIHRNEFAEVKVGRKTRIYSTTEPMTKSIVTGTSYLTRESTSAYSGVTTVTTIGPAPIPEPSTDGKHILFLGKNNGRSGLFSNDCGLTWETVTSIFPEFDDGSTYAVQKTAFKLVWHSGYFYFLRVVSKQKYSYSSNYYHWLDIHRIKDDLTGTSEQVLAPYELEYIGNTPTSASVILSTAEAISGTIYLSAKVNSSTVLELDFDAFSVVAAVYQTGSVETIRYLPDIGLIGMRNYKLGSSSGNTYNWVFKDILSSSPISIFPIQYSGSAQMYFTLLDSAHSPGLVHSRDTLLQANWTNAAGGSSKIGYFVDESGTTSFDEISGLGSIIFQDMGTGSNSWIDENFFAYQFGDYLVYSIYKDKAVYVVSNFGSNSPTRTVLFGGTNSGPSLGCVCKDRIILTRNRNIYTVDLANVSSTQVASNVISFSNDSCCFCVNTQNGNCLK